MKIKIKNQIIAFTSAIITVFAFNVKIMLPNIAEGDGTIFAYLTNFFSKLAQNFDGFAIWWDILVLCLSYVYYTIVKNITKLQLGPIFKIASIITASFFGIINVMTISIIHTDSLDFLTKNRYQLMISVICIIGYALIFIYTLVGVLELLLLTQQYGPTEKREQFCSNLTWIKVFACILVFWSPWLIAFYPGSITWDMFYELNQYMGWLPLSNAHPIFSVWLMGSCLAIGHSLVSYNFGAYLYILLQSFVCAASFSYSITIIGRISKRRYMQYLALSFYAFVPIWGSFVEYGIKDVLYTGVITAFISAAVLIYWNLQRDLKCNFREKSILVSTSVLAVLLRHNGKFMIYPILLVLLIISYKNKVIRRIIRTAFLISILFYIGVDIVLVSHLGIPQSSKRESLSLMFQATARCIRERENLKDELTEEQISVINQIFSAEEVGNVYNPVVSDPVKRLYRLDGHPYETDVLKRYKKVWWQMMRKYPKEYFEAIIAQTYGYLAFVPESGVPIAVLRPYIASNYPGLNADKFQIEYASHMVSMRGFLNSWGNLFQHIPPFGILYSFAFYTWGYIIMALSSIASHKRKFLLLLIPIIANAIGSAASPVNANTRYFLPLMAVAPIICCVFVSELRQDKRNEEKACVTVE